MSVWYNEGEFLTLYNVANNSTWTIKTSIGACMLHNTTIIRQNNWYSAGIYWIVNQQCIESLTRIAYGDFPGPVQGDIRLA